MLFDMTREQVADLLERWKAFVKARHAKAVKELAKPHSWEEAARRFVKAHEDAIKAEAAKQRPEYAWKYRCIKMAQAAYRRAPPSKKLRRDRKSVNTWEAACRRMIHRALTDLNRIVYSTWGNWATNAATNNRQRVRFKEDRKLRDETC